MSGKHLQLGRSLSGSDRLTLPAADRGAEAVLDEVDGPDRQHVGRGLEPIWQPCAGSSCIGTSIASEYQARQYSKRSSAASASNR
jgi:hypothetical protein